ncbi:MULTISPECIES: class I SAM-dependent methyltransferase [Cyanophyceae]|uniref:class I SAM-dependent methyltransferase n=1 Tax=Cyanophyceae TaxID=3028117 RepID=UPI001684D938|nr:class I SAM-dependent methyltransferase [Trichocoleus sp. FACHB-832]MBD1905410.1 class I SAM-dependent methyltransferase [Trichocoleus sp. FACHB-832]
MLDTTDLSPADFHFDPDIGLGVRDRLRDIADTLIRRPLYKILYDKKFVHQPYPINLVLPGKGLSTLARRRWVNRYMPLSNSRVLVIGCGSAWDFGSYLRFKPKEIVGIDLYNFASCWQKVQEYVTQANLPTNLTFYQTDIAEVDKTLLGEFDIICSDAVFEHCRDLKSVLKNLYILLRPGGIMYASYGPIWYCLGGDHFSGRGGLENGYNHLMMEPTDYQSYYHAHLRDPAYELQNGGRYIELDLFSKLSASEYFELYQEIGFQPKSVVVDFGKQAESLRTAPIFKQVLTKYTQLTSEDLLLRGHFLILEKT